MKARHVVTTFLITVLILAIGINTHARLFSNMSEGGFDETDTLNITGDYSTGSLTIREIIIKGAGAFFKAQGSIKTLSEKVELSDLDGIDFGVTRETLKTALDNMYNARYYYQLLEIKANQTPYNFNVIIKLIYFDYNGFQYENGLIKDVFDEVKVYLGNGDIRGAYSRISAYFDSLIGILETIKKDMDAGIFPANTDLWKLNQICAKVHMFGQYIAMVFETIK